MKTPLYCFLSLARFSIFGNPSPSPPPLPTVFVWLNMWLLNDMVDLNFLNFDTLVPEAPCFVFYATRSKVYCWFVPNDMTFASTLIWYHTCKQIYTAHTETNRPTHKYILIAPVTYLQQLSILSLTGIKNVLHRSSVSLLFKNYSYTEVTYLMIRFSKTKSFFWNTKNTDKNCR